MKSTHLWTLAAVAGALLLTNLPLQASERDDRIVSSFPKTEIYQDNLRSDEINIRSHNGNVTLSGTAANAHHKMLAGDAARSLRGVKSVDNDIRVEGKYASDSKCSDRTSCCSTYSDGVPKSRFLDGEEARICSNGNSYSNSRRGPIDHYQTRSDRSTTQSIREAVYADSSLDRAYNDISIETVNGHVTLTGRVATQSEKNGIQDKAREFAHRDMIHNEIVVTRN